MKLRPFFCLTVSIISLGIQAQNTFPSTGAVGIGTTAPNISSLLEVNSTTKGVLTPRMTLAQRNAISTPAQGLLIFQTDGTTGFYFYNSGWKAISPATSGFANKTLSNLKAPTTLNQSLLPKATNTYDFGSSSYAWKNLYLKGYVYLDGARFLSNHPGTGAHNTLVGSYTGNGLTSGTHNTALGHAALYKTTSGSANSALGAYALYNNTAGYSNTAVGTRALYFNTTGHQNTALGDSALYSNTEGYINTASGDYALYSNTTGVLNCAMGAYALYKNTTGNFNTALGYGALYSNLSSTANTAVGLLALNNNTGGNNTALGYDAGDNSNTSQGTFIGAFANSRSGLNNVTALGASAQVTASNQVRIGNTAVTSIGGQVNWTAFSDGRYKQNIHEDVHGLDFINKLRPITYTIDIKGLNDYYQKSQQQPGGSTINNKIAADDSKAEAEASKIVYNGFVAQEVEQAAQKLNYSFSGVDKPQNGDGLYGLRYSDFVVPLVKAVQELDSANRAKDQRIDQQQQQIDELRKMVVDLRNGQGNTLTLNSAYLEQNTPNPVNSTTRIGYHVPETITSARLDLSNVKGQLVKTMNIVKGTSQVNLNTAAFAAGTYNYTLYVDGKPVDSKRLVIAR